MTIAANIILGDIVLFSAYNIYVLSTFRIPDNLSMTYYWFERKRKGAGLFFPAMLCLMCATVIPVWLHTTAKMTVFGHHLAWIPYAVLFCILMVALSARYKRHRGLVYFHYAMAILCAFFAIGWIFFMCLRYIYIGVSILLLAVWAAIWTRTFVRSYLYWLEITAFYALFLTLFVINCFNLAG